MDEENTFDLANYIDLIDEDYVTKEVCRCDFYIEYVPEGESSPLSTQPTGAKTVETPLPPQEILRAIHSYVCLNRRNKSPRCQCRGDP